MEGEVGGEQRGTKATQTPSSSRRRGKRRAWLHMCAAAYFMVSYKATLIHSEQMFQTNPVD